MHVHANYSLEMASLGGGQLTTREVSARRSAEVRKKLSTAAAAINDAGDEITAVHARTPDQQQNQHHKEPDEGEFGRFFSARV